MRIALIADAYPPLRTSGAVQVRDLAQELASQGNDVTVIVPAPGAAVPWRLERVGGVQVLALASPATKDVSYVRRTVAEALMPLCILRGIRRSPLRSASWEAVIWYSPSIFLGLLVGALKRSRACRSYPCAGVKQRNDNGHICPPNWQYEHDTIKKGKRNNYVKNNNRSCKTSAY